MIFQEWESQLRFKAKLCVSNEEVLSIIYEEFQNGHKDEKSVIALISIITDCAMHGDTKPLTDNRYIKMERQYNRIKKKLQK